MRTTWPSCGRFGVKASLADVVTVGGAVQHLLAETRSGRTACVVGTAALRRHVEDAGLKVLNGTDLASRADVVVVGGTDEMQLLAAARCDAGGSPRGRPAGHGPRPFLPMPEGPWPGTGALLAADRDRVGARSPRSWASPRRACSTPPWTASATGRTLVVGDRLDSDVAAAAAAGLDAVLVLSGGGARQAAADDAERRGRSAVADSLDELVSGALMARKTHHKHSSTKGYRRLLDGLAELDGRASRGHRTGEAADGLRPPGGADIEGAATRSRGCRSRSTPTGRSWTPTWSPTGRRAVEAAMRERGWTLLVVHAQQRAAHGVTMSPAPAPRPAPPRARCRAAVVHVGGHDGGHEVGVAVAVHRHGTAPAQLAPQERQRSSSTAAPSSGERSGTWCQVSPSLS